MDDLCDSSFGFCKVGGKCYVVGGKLSSCLEEDKIGEANDMVENYIRASGKN